MTATKKQSKPARLADEIESLGWRVERRKNGTQRGVRAQHPDGRVVIVEFVRKQLSGPIGGQRDVFWKGEAFVHDASGEVERIELRGIAEAMRIIRAAPDVPFALDASDDAVLAAVAGKVIEWVGRLTGKAQSGAVPRGGVHLRLVSGTTSRGEAIAPEDRVLHFTDPHGFHAVRLATIVKVS